MVGKLEYHSRRTYSHEGVYNAVERVKERLKTETAKTSNSAEGG